jgi:hypothetical protein
MREALHVKDYVVTATRVGKWWAIEVVGLKLGYTQTRRLSEVEPTVRELIAGLKNVDENAFNITIRLNVADAETVTTAERLRMIADEARSAADQAARAAALALVANDIPVRDVATMLHVSPAWVSVLTKDREAV